MTKSFDELLEPYVENGRSIAGQITWLRFRKGFPPNIVEQAMQEVYTEMDQGKTFADGNELDQYLLAKAKEIREEDIKASIERMQHRITSLTAPKFEGGRIKKVWAALCGKL